MEKDGLIPMSFIESLNAVSVPKRTRKAIEKLISVKNISEIGEGKRISLLRQNQLSQFGNLEIGIINSVFILV